MSMVQKAVEAGAPPPVIRKQTGAAPPDGVGSTQLTGRSSGVFGGRTRLNPASPASIAARVKRRTTTPPTAAGAGASSGAAPMGGRTPAKDLWGDGMINEADRGSAHDY